MKLSVFAFVVLIVLVQIYSYQAKLTESSADNENLKHFFNKRKPTSGTLNGLWGKRSESESDELRQHILRELYHNARRNQLAHARYLSEDDVNPLTLEELLAQRRIWNDDMENTAENNS